MPIYEYQCRSCGHEFEVLQKISDPKLTDCPECHQASLQKKMSAVAFRLKGGGWYETDFKTGDKKNVAGDKPPGEGAAKEGSTKEGSAKEGSAKSDSGDGGGKKQSDDKGSNKNSATGKTETKKSETGKPSGGSSST